PPCRAASVLQCPIPANPLAADAQAPRRDGRAFIPVEPPGHLPVPQVQPVDSPPRTVGGSHKTRRHPRQKLICHQPTKFVDSEVSITPISRLRLYFPPRKFLSVMQIMHAPFSTSNCCC